MWLKKGDRLERAVYCVVGVLQPGGGEWYCYERGGVVRKTQDALEARRYGLSTYADASAQCANWLKDGTLVDGIVQDISKVGGQMRF